MQFLEQLRRAHLSTLRIVGLISRLDALVDKSRDVVITRVRNSLATLLRTRDDNFLAPVENGHHGGEIVLVDAVLLCAGQHIHVSVHSNLDELDVGDGPGDVVVRHEDEALLHFSLGDGFPGDHGVGAGFGELVVEFDAYFGADRFPVFDEVGDAFYGFDGGLEPEEDVEEEGEETVIGTHGGRWGGRNAVPRRCVYVCLYIWM